MLSHLYAPQGEYSAAQNRTTDKPVEYVGCGADLYLKQLQHFCDIVNAGKTDYFYADRAVQVQEIIDEIYS